MEVLIYVDDGVVERSRVETPRAFARIVDTDQHPIRTVDRSYFLSDRWEETSTVLVMPGGRDVPYSTALHGQANARIRRFVESGGAYIGFCAGGYYGARSVEFDRGHPLEVVGDRELGFFAGAAVGPAYGPGTFSYESDRGARAAVLEWCAAGPTSGRLPVFYNGGCTFDNAEQMPEVEILARYAELPQKPAAIIACTVGAGVAILSGVHPEYSARSFRGASGALATVYEHLISAEDARLMILRDIARRAGLTVVG